MSVVRPSPAAGSARMRTATLRFLALGLALAALPAIAVAQVSIAYLSDSRLTLNSNKPCTEGPHAQYVHFRVTNTGSTTLAAPSATLSGFSNGITLGGGQPATIAFAPLAPGASWDGFWYLQYPCSIGTATTVTLTVRNGAAAVGTMNQTLTTYAMLAAQAGGNLVAQSLTAVTLGAISYLSVGYEFGGADSSATYLVQPAGTPSFNAGCFQLLGSEVTASNVTAMPVGTKNKLFFTATAKQAGSGFTVTFRYTFRAMCAGVSTVAQPFANMLSGQQLKYSGNFDSWGSGGQSTVPGAGNPFKVRKRVTPDTLSDGGTVTYTVVIRNDSIQPSTIDSIADVLPPGVRYLGLDAASQVSAANSMAVPSVNATGRILWRSVPGVYYPVNGRDSLVLVYRATIPPPEGTYTNSVSGYVAAVRVDSAATNVVVRRIADVSVTKTGPASASMDDTVRFVLTVANAGPSAARAVTLSDTLPAALQFVRATRGGTFASGVVTWPAIDSMPPSTTVRDTVVTVVRTAGAVTNIAATRSPRLDPKLANNNGSDSTSRVTLTLSLPSITVAVAPNDPTPIKRLAGTAYAVPFTVTNGSGHAESFDVLLRRGQLSAAVLRDSITATGVAAPSTDSLRLALPDATPRTVSVWYTVTFGDTAAERFTLVARAVRNPAVRDSGLAVIRRAAPALTIAKSVSPAAGPVAPGVELTYTSTFQNAGDFAARGAAVDEALPAEVMLKLGSVAPTLPTGVASTIEYSTDGGNSWGYAPASGACGAPAGFDGCVTRVRLVLGSDLAPAAVGTLVYTARVR